MTSVFVPLTTVEVTLPAAGKVAAGGGLTANPDGSVTLLRQDGSFWQISSDGEVARLPLEPPENNFEAYAAFAQTDAGAEYTHNFGWFRYNDVERISRNGQEALLASFSHYDARGECHSNRIAQLDLTEGELAGKASEWQTIYTSEPCLPLKKTFRAIEGHMAGGRLAYDGDAHIYIANGEFHFDGVYGPEDMIIAQDPDGHYGGVVRVSLETQAAEVLSRGQRNTQGITVDGQRRVWVAEHGVRGGDELNLLREGANYGWPRVSYGTSYSALPLRTVAPEDLGRHEGYEKPVFSFLPSIATSSLITVENFHETWNGDLLLGSLRAQMLVRIRIADERVVFTERIYIGQRMRDVEETAKGEIALWTDNNSVVFLQKRKGGLGGKYVQYRLGELSDRPDFQNAVAATIARCQECHSMNAGEHESAPSLAMLMGRGIGSTPYDGYSDVLRRDSRVWDRALLESYLANPDESFAGTSMPQAEMTDDVREEIINILEGLSTDVVIPGPKREL